VRLTARIPATSANLGPGFDCFGLALELVNEVSVDTEGAPGVVWEGEGAAELPTDGTDLVTRSMQVVADESHRALPPFSLHSVNRIPLERGLGSSSAACVAGVALAARLLDREALREPAELCRVASRLEGHPDNAAAAVFGGLTLALPDGEVVRLVPHVSLRPVVLIPAARLATADARRALSPEVSRADAVFNLAHAAATVQALTRQPDLLATALRDRLHQQARLAMVPEVAALFGALVDRGVPVVVSGAGPTLLAFEGDVIVPDPGVGWTVLRPAVRARGVELVES
jgi:homoserine kinase